MGRYLAAHKGLTVEVVSGTVFPLIWTVAQHETRLPKNQLPVDKLTGIALFAAAKIAHDINNPLQLILGLAEHLLDEQDQNVIREHTKEIIEAVKRTSAMCCDLTRNARRRLLIRDRACGSLSCSRRAAFRLGRHTNLRAGATMYCRCA